MKFKILYIAIILTLSAFVTLSLMNKDIEPFDTGLYHTQSIEYYKTGLNVIGIGNLHFRLAFTNFYFALIAVFEYLIPDIKSFYVFNPLLIFFLIFYLLYSFVQLLYKSRIDYRIFFTSILILFIIYNPLFTVSVSPDTFSGYLSIIILFYLLFTDYVSKKDFYIVFFTIVYLISVKITNAPLFLFLIPSYLKLRKKIKLRYLFLILSIILIPWLIISTLSSGFLVYPILKFPFLNLDWSLPDSDGIMLSKVVRGWARLPNEFSMDSLNEPISIWFLNWFNHYFKHNMHNFQGLVYLYLSSFIILILASLFFIFSDKYNFKLDRKIRNLIQILILCIIPISIWFYSSPDPRFAYGVLIVFPCLIISILLAYIYKLLFDSSKYSKAFLSCILLFFIILKIDFNFVFKLNFDQEYPTVKGKYMTNSFGFSYFLPEKGVCWNSDLYCAPNGASNIKKINYKGFIILKQNH